MNDTQRLFELYFLHRNKLATKQEQEEFDRLLSITDNEELLKNYFNDTWEKLKVDAYSLQEIPNSEKIFLDIVSSPQKVSSKTKVWPKWIAVAAIMLATFTGSYFYFKTESNQLESTYQANDIAPGKNGATLTLANGQKILINNALTGNIAVQNGVKISKDLNGQIIYEITNQDFSSTDYNTLSTTRGEQTQIRLPDGTVVFLNAESSLRYPVNFAKTEKRIVSLDGEGFFNVTSDKTRPFIVKTAQQEVEVLGTQFNVKSYKDENASKTTLLEGSVKVSTTNKMERILKPDQQATVSAQGITVENVEAQFATDWKEGFFMFDNESLESIMKRLSRWYAIKVEFKDPNLKNVKVTGTVSKYDNISKVIAVLEQGKLAKFSISDGVLSIK